MQNLSKKGYYWDLSSELIAYNTVSYNSNSPCAQYIGFHLEDLGFSVSIDSYLDDSKTAKQQVVGRIGPDVDGGLILSGHIDTVPFERQAGWTKDALCLTHEGDKLYGRGTCDMKIFIAQVLYSLKKLDLKKLKKPIVCAFTSDEETGCHGSARLIKNFDHLLGDIPRPRRAIIGEPTSFKVVDTHKGMGHFDLTIFGKAWHSSRPDQGINSILEMRKILELVESLNHKYKKASSKEMQDHYPDFPQNYLHLARVEAGEALNMVPDKTTLRFSFRSFPFETPLRVFHDFKELLEKSLTQQSYVFSEPFCAPAMPKPKDQSFSQCLEDVSQQKGCESASFATDGGNFSLMGIDCLVWGPGQISVAHRPDEFMPVEDYLKGPDYICKVIEKTLF